jgi:hypothetical protein
LITPAILILACASLISSCLMRLARVVDRVRTLTQMSEDIRLGKCTDCTKERRQEIHDEFDFYQRRGKVISPALGLMYGTVCLWPPVWQLLSIFRSAIQWCSFLWYSSL